MHSLSLGLVGVPQKGSSVLHKKEWRMRGLVFPQSWWGKVLASLFFAQLLWISATQPSVRFQAENVSLLPARERDSCPAEWGKRQDLGEFDTWVA